MPTITCAGPRFFILNLDYSSLLMIAISDFSFTDIRRSSTYNAMFKTLEASCRTYKHRSFGLLSKFSSSTKKFCILAYHWRGDCFRPYNDLRNLHTLFLVDSELNPLGTDMETSASKFPFRNAVTTSFARVPNQDGSRRKVPYEQ